MARSRKNTEDITNNGLAKRAKYSDELSGNWFSAGKTQSKGKIPAMRYYDPKSEKANAKIAAFDFDYTIVAVKSKNKFPKDADDWIFLYDCVPQRLRDLHKSGYRVVIFSNQAGVTKGKSKLSELEQKYENVIKALEIPALVFIATGEDEWRKPNIKMWKFFIENCNDNIEPDLKQCFYVGDAAGRPKNWRPGKPKDFSCSDRMFAANIGIDFKTPEEFFLNEKPCTEFSWGTIDPKSFLIDDQMENLAYHSNEREMIILCGAPGSGKSTFASTYFQPYGYVIVNRDILGTRNKCVQLTNQALKDGKSVVIDNTNISKAIRKEYIDIAKNAGVPVRCFFLETPLKLCEHLNNVRVMLSDGEIKKVPAIAFNIYKGQFQEPDTSEGFISIEKVAFKPKFNSEEHKKLFLMWTC